MRRAQLRIHVEYLEENEFYSRAVLTYSWDGPSHLPIRIPVEYLERAGCSASEMFGFPVWEVKRSLYVPREATFARVDGWRFFTWLWWWLLERLERLNFAILRPCYRLAHRSGWFNLNPGEMMSWRGLFSNFRRVRRVRL